MSFFAPVTPAVVNARPSKSGVAIAKNQRCIKNIVALVFCATCASFTFHVTQNYTRRVDDLTPPGVILPDDLCATLPPRTCYDLVKNSPSSVLLSISCDIGEIYPELTLTQGHLRVTLLGTLTANTLTTSLSKKNSQSRADLQNNRQHTYVFDLDGCGLAAGDANVSSKLYMHCITDLYGENPQSRNHARPVINSPVEIGGLRTIFINEKLEPTKPIQPENGRLQVLPLAFDLSKMRTTLSPIHGGAIDNVTIIPNNSPTEYEWIHLVGDSVTRGIYMDFCKLCPTSPDDVGLTQLRNTGTCVCNETRMIVHFDQTWLDWTPLINRSGALMSEFAAPGSIGAHVQKRALLTFVSLGSHTPEYSRKRLEAAVPDFIQRFHNVTSGRLVLMLTTAVCIEMIPPHHERTHSAWEMLLRNNYRLRLLNELIACSCADLSIPFVDLFSLSLSAGCGGYADAIHFKSPMQAALIEPMITHFLPWLLKST
jgi:hypothetical protein